jgi:hypothetical protein
LAGCISWAGNRALSLRSGSRFELGMNKAYLRRAVVYVVAARVVFGALAWISVTFSPTHFSYTREMWNALQTTHSSWLWPFVAPWQQWDGLWLQHVAMSGYSSGGPEASFFPLFPLLEHAAGWILGGNFGLGGLVVSTVACVGALYVLQLLVGMDFDSTIATRATLLLMLLPEAFFLLAPFTEATFLFASLVCFYAARRRMWAVAAGAGLLAGLARPVAVFLAVAMAVECFQDARVRRATGSRVFRAGYLATVTPVIGVALFWIYMAVALRIPGGPFSLQGYWHTHLEWPWVALWDSIQNVLTRHDIEELMNLLSAAAVIVSIPFMWKRLPASYTAYTIAMLTTVCFRESGTTPLMSGARYSLVIFPIVVLGSKVLARQNLRQFVYLGLASLQVVMFVFFVRADFIG